MSNNYYDPKREWRNAPTSKRERRLTAAGWDERAARELARRTLRQQLGTPGQRFEQFLREEGLA